jgi:hypothetical protein
MILAFGIEFSISISPSVKIFPPRFLILPLGMNGLFPSTKMSRGRGSSYKILSYIAFMEAFRIFISSIIKDSICVIANEMHCCSI